MEHDVSDIDCVRTAILGKDEDRKRVARIGISVVAQILRKNADYGCSAWKPPVLIPTLPVNEAILVRMSDKIARMQSLSGKDPEIASESISDTIADLAGYSILWLARPEVTNEQ